jgi:hypothetical protein
MRCGQDNGLDQLIEYLGDVWEELWDAVLFKLKATKASML